MSFRTLRKSEFDNGFCLQWWFSSANTYCGMAANQSVTGDQLFTFAKSYASFHGYISICVCVFGIITNIFNIIVLTRRHMSTPVNIILSWLAVSDIITMMSYVPFSMHFYCMYPDVNKTPDKNSKSWMTYMTFHINLAATTHTVSIWLCVLLAIVRFVHIRSPTKAFATRRRRMTQSKVLILLIYVWSAISLIPNYMSNELQENLNPESNETTYVLRDLRLGKNDTDALVLVNVWMYAVTAKLVPCLLMSIFGSLLIYNIHVKIRHRRKVLKISGANSMRLTEHSRTTKMLVSVILLFLVTELPQGVLIVCSATVKDFFDTVYLPLGDVMDIVALINNAVNFILYCTMSTKFRETFVHLFCACHFPHSNESIGYTLTDRLAKLDSHSNNNEHQNHINHVV